MKALGVIVEYNPFHNGHKYHLEKACEKENFDVVIAVMSGDFVQRGEPSIIDKWSKAEIAVKNGVDLVVELPVFYSTQSAEVFAKGAVGILNELKCNTIVFGSESGDVKKLSEIAGFQESEDFKNRLKEKLKEGKSYPTAHSETMEEILKKERLASNDILALEYIKAKKYWKSDIQLKAIVRSKVGYHELRIKENFASATKIRELILEKQDFSQLVPYSTFEIINKIEKKVTMGDFFNILKYEIIKKQCDYNNIQDLEIGFENRIEDLILKSENYEEFIEKLTTKRYTKSRIQRALLHILLNLTKDMTEKVKEDIPYVKVLAFNEKGKKYLSYLKEFENKKIITSYKKMNEIFEKEVCSLIEYNERCSEIYRLINPYKQNKIPLILSEVNNE